MWSDCWLWRRQPPQSPEMSQRSWNWITGLFFIFVVTVIWTAASYLTRYIFDDLNFRSPFLFTYFSSSFFVLYLPLWQLWVQFGWVINPPSQHRACRTKTSAKTGNSNSEDRVCTTCKNVYKRRKSVPAENKDGSIVTGADENQSYILLDQSSEDGHENIVHFHNLDSEEGSLDLDFLDINHIGYPSRVGFFREVFNQLCYSGVQRAEVETEITTDFTCQSCYSDSGTNISPSKTLSPFHDLSDSGEESRQGRISRDEFADAAKVDDVSQRKSHSVTETVLQRKFRTKQSMRENVPLKYTHTDMLSIAIVLCPLWFISNCCYNYALLYTSVASSTIISNLSAGFTLFFSWWYGVEKLTVSKILGVSICFVGVGLVALADSNSNTKNLVATADESTVTTPLNVLGDMMAVLGAAGYGLYTTVLRVKVKDDESASMQLLLGYMGLVNALILSPPLFLMAIMDWGNVRQLTWTAFGFIFISGFFDDVISDYLWARSILLTSPTVATVGLTLTIPMAIFIDYFTLPSNSSIGASSLFGALLVLLGFLVVTANFGQKSVHHEHGHGHSDTVR